MAEIQWVQAFFGTGWMPVFIGITYLGSEYAYIALLTLYYWLINPQVGRQLGLLLGLSYACNTVIKDLLNLPRPFDLNPNIASPGAKETIENASFPSGHAQGSATFWFYLAWHHARPWLWGLSVAIALLVALSRLYLGVHFPQDVVGGLLFGLLFAWGGTRWSFPRRRGILWPAIAVLLTFVLAVLWPSLARSLGVSIGFFLTSPDFAPPSTWKGKLLLGGLGLPIVVGFYWVSKWAIALWDVDWIDYWRYLAIVLVATELWPRVILKKESSAV